MLGNFLVFEPLHLAHHNNNPMLVRKFGQSLFNSPSQFGIRKQIHRSQLAPRQSRRTRLYSTQPPGIIKLPTSHRTAAPQPVDGNVPQNSMQPCCESGLPTEPPNRLPSLYKAVLRNIPSVLLISDDLVDHYKCTLSMPSDQLIKGIPVSLLTKPHQHEVFLCRSQATLFSCDGNTNPSLRFS